MRHKSEYCLLWEFRVQPGVERQFEHVYGPNGEWAQLFRLDDAYLGTELLQDISTPGRYLTLDRWRSREAYESFHRHHAEEYRHIDEKCERMTQGERALGTYAVVSHRS